MALAPKRPLFGVPSSSIMSRSISGLLRGVLTMQALGDLAIHVADGVLRALSQIARLVAVAQFHGFVFSGGGAGGHSRPTHAAIGQVNIRFHGGIAARIEDFPACYSNDGCHKLLKL